MSGKSDDKEVETVNILRSKQKLGREVGKTKQSDINNRKGNKVIRKNMKQKRKKSGGKVEINLRVGTWNVRGTYEEGALKHLSREIKKIRVDLVALQETKQKGNEIVEIEDYMLFNSGGKNIMLGTGFMIHNKLKAAVIQFKPVSERMCILRMRGKYQKMAFINIHAPTEESQLDEKEEFYNMLDMEYDKLAK
ncbi:uncharacterized protein LOC108913478 [Anoplophora glabripennis]|uniref:uncharacterized protein LOC108913478 n=1 Tax=Anoplophora glabripennis TaxID=217634 RepID=UPI000873B251|nr:uncharacterized protein LOC108913478 [Anoplophora glabripennis]